MTFESRISFELIDDDLEAPGFRVSAQGNGYAGVTDIWLMRPDADAFLDSLDRLDASLRGEALLRAGWVEPGEEATDAMADLLLAIRPWGHAGQLEVDVTVRASASQGGKNMARIWFVLPEPNVLTRFRHALRALAAGGVGAPPVILTADFTA
jgi:hypothetical protein